MQYISNLYLIYSIAAIGLLGWLAMDMRSILKAGQRKNQLSIEGRWKELDEHFERMSNSWRPFVRLHDRYLLPGNFLTQHALFLYNRGRFEDALAKVELAIQRLKNKPQIFKSIHKSATLGTQCGALKARTLILTGMGRYDEARSASAELASLEQSARSSNPPLALLEFSCGRLDETLALTQAVTPKDPQYDSMRVITALALSMKGEFDQAAEALLYEPGDMTKFYTPENLKLVSGTPEGARLIELQNKKVAGVFPPARLIVLAQVNISREDFKAADLALDQAEKKLGPEPGIQFSYCRHRASSLAAQGKSAEAENHIQRMRAIVQELPKRSLLWETHFSAGRCHTYLGRFDDAFVEFKKAQQFILHPIERHSTNYWIGRICEAMGDQSNAIPFYQAVVADGIPSWMRKKAAEIIGAV